MTEERSRKSKREKVKLEAPSQEEVTITTSLLSKLLGTNAVTAEELKDRGNEKPSPLSTPTFSRPVCKTDLLAKEAVVLNEPVQQTTLLPDKPVHADSSVLNKPVRQTALLSNGPVYATNLSDDNGDKDAGFIKISHEIMDNVLPQLDTFEQSVYLRLYRLSHGFGQTTCTVGMSSLMRACNIKETACRTVLRRLINLGLIQLLEVRNDGQVKGSTYVVKAGLSNELVCITNRSVVKTSVSNEPGMDGA